MLPLLNIGFFTVHFSSYLLQHQFERWWAGQQCAEEQFGVLWLTTRAFRTSNGSRAWILQVWPLSSVILLVVTIKGRNKRNRILSTAHRVIAVFSSEWLWFLFCRDILETRIKTVFREHLKISRDIPFTHVYRFTTGSCDQDEVRPVIAGFRSLRDKENILRHCTSSKSMKKDGIYCTEDFSSKGGNTRYGSALLSWNCFAFPENQALRF